MGGVVAKVMTVAGNNEKKDENDEVVIKDSRRRNSLAYYISAATKKELLHEEKDTSPLDDIRELYTACKNEKIASNPFSGRKVKDTKFTKIVKSVLGGNFRELKNQVVLSWKTINRKYKDQFLGYHLIHFVCQEGYAPMLAFMLNPGNHSEFDETTIEISPTNDRHRTPLMLAFTPTVFTYNAVENGLDEHGEINLVRPEGLETLQDWVKPGGPDERHEIVKLLLEHGASADEKDYHDYTPLHYAVILGWTQTVQLLLDYKADPNASTVAGKNALHFCVEFDREEILEILLRIEEIHIDAADSDGVTPLIAAVEKGGDKGLLSAGMLVKRGADPNLANARRKTPLKIACVNQDMSMVNLLLDSKVQRRPSAFALLDAVNFDRVERRMQAEDKRAKDLAEKEERERLRKALEGANPNDVRTRNPWGQWDEYNDKRGRGIFYYNKVSRFSQWEQPPDFKKDNNRVVKDASFGLHFYH